MENKKYIPSLIFTLLILILISTILFLLNNKKYPVNGYVLPSGYTLNNYKIERVLEISCKKDEDCETPFEYQIQSRCPFTSKCLDKKCTVICPDHQSPDQSSF